MIKMKTLPKIENCPCGAKARIHHTYDKCRRFFVYCPRCGCSSYRRLDLKDAIDAWNKGLFTFSWSM